MASFTRGFMSSAGSGALMSGIFYGLAGITGIIPFSLAVLPVAGLMVGAVGLFGGVMAAKRAGDDARANAPIQRDAATQARSQSRGQSHTLVPAIAADRAEGPSWAERTGGPQGNRLQQILDNGSLSDRGRAQAILAEREAAMNAQQQR